ncbi:MAG: bifunctional adenosylcobinamide kinase/adenosylcobinamide-phosphate guanylyltransferase [Fervidobacterium sp.]|uniref:Adenosylcobinamide kinase n=1 Tax=Fervidobacterium gondwanense DSM 13020 TaxID=1121883 RepID=A0A1M7TAN1_FERGO|nr:bifunctional adenosylcobinamide kinase/adenosylcobinamide-phosphate guanylyltransferase [Fervidobacterium gondwanense]SHN67771.1 adenosylcobinamide kinase /adenosylcobinamide-phosphate guanylyltransferase [Fervidobacterium gondwanense DSM 13020]
MITLITGGVKSGKSTFAQNYILKKPYSKRAYIATSVPFDDEMRERIERHKKERGTLFDAFEEPVEVHKVLKKLSGGYDVALIECITTYLGNLFHYNYDVENYTENLINILETVDYDVVIVTNEVGFGIVPENKLARQYAETLGKLNSRLAGISNEVYVLFSGIEVRIR